MTTRIPPIDPAQAQGKAGELLAGVKSKLGITPNMMRTMAQSPAVLEGYLALNSALARGAFNGKIQEQIALAVAELNGCGYCAAAHTALGKRAGLTDEQTVAARMGTGTDPRADAALRLARRIIEERGSVTDEDLEAARTAGLGDAEIAEVVAHVALNVFTNYFNLVAGTEIDFPKVQLGTVLSL